MLITGQQAPEIMHPNAQIRVNEIKTVKGEFGKFTSAICEWNRPDIDSIWRTVPLNSKQAIEVAKYVKSH